MKKLVIGIFAILIVCLGLEVGAKELNSSGVNSTNKNLIIYNWGDYIDPKLIKNLKNKLVIMLFMKLLILMKLCTLKLNKVVRHMIFASLLTI